MRVDRDTFLLIAFSMWGCNSASGRDTAVAVVDIPPMPAAAARSDGGASIDEAPARPPPTAIAEGEDDGPMPTEEPGWVTNEDVSCGKAPPGASARSSQASCNDSGGSTPSCSSLRRCASGDFQFTRDRCDDYRRYLKPKVAERAVRCMTSLSSKNVCDACNAYRCGDEALMSSCTDPSADTPCRTITRACASVSLNECRAYLSGMNSQGRAKMVQCLSASSGCSFGLYSCSESL